MRACARCRGGRSRSPSPRSAGKAAACLREWIVAVAERYGWLVQLTFGAGSVAQSAPARRCITWRAVPSPPTAAPAPVFALMPVPGDVDVVIAAELMEAGRAVVRGLVSADRTTLVASSHRVYGISEKSAMGDGIADSDAVLTALKSESRRLVCFDMDAIAAETGSVISSVLFGALAGSGVLPFPRELYEEAIRSGGVSVGASLEGFAQGFEQALKNAPVAGAIAPGAAPTSEAGRRLDAKIRGAASRASAWDLHRRGRTAPSWTTRDSAYPQIFISPASPMRCVSTMRRREWPQLLRSLRAARYLAASWMTYEMTAWRTSRPAAAASSVEPARGARRATGRHHMHPRFQELCETPPAPGSAARCMIGRGARLLAPVPARRHMNTAKLAGFLHSTVCGPGGVGGAERCATA